MLVEKIIKLSCALLMAMAIALSGMGMEAAHAKASGGDNAVEGTHSHGNHGDHAAHAHASHGQQDEATAPVFGHGDHTDCAMAACCHLGATALLSAQLIVIESRNSFNAWNAHQYADAEKDRADKPPKHV